MRELTINELMLLTRIKLCDLLTRITNELTNLAEGSPERASALTSLHNIRSVLLRRNLSL